MKTWVRKSISVGVMAAGGLLATQAAAQADVVTTGNYGALNGTQVVVPIQIPIDVCGNSVALIGGAQAACGGGAIAANAESSRTEADIISAGNYGLLNGTQVYAPIQAPINVCGNAIALIGAAQAACDGGAVAVNGGGENDDDDNDNDGYNRRHHGDDEFTAMAEGKYKHGKKHGDRDGRDAFEADIVSAGNYGLLNGTQIVVPIQVPINVAGNAIGIIGGAFAQATGGAAAVNESARVEGYDRGQDTEANLISTNNFGALNGTQLYAPIQIPINVCGNAISLIGGAFAQCGGGAFAINESATTEGASREEANLISTNNFGLGNGTQLYAPIQVPINVCGNAISVIGLAQAACAGGAFAFNESDSTEGARDEALPLVGSLPVVSSLPVVGGLTGGGQSAAPAAPKMDNALGARGATEGDDYDDDDDRGHGKHGKKHGKKHGNNGNAASPSGAVAVNGGGTNMVSANNFGALNGTQVYAPIQVPVNVAGNAIGIIGGAFAQSTGGALALNG